MPAPIEGVAVIFREKPPAQHEIEVTSGLPNGCARFERVSLTRDGDTFVVEVMNTMPAGADMVCTDVYGTVKNSIAVPGELEPGREYLVVANGVESAFAGQGGPGSGAPGVLGRVAMVEPAPIHEVTIGLEDGGPADLSIVYGLPNACYSFEESTLTVAGDGIDVRVLIGLEQPVGGGCVEIYRTGTAVMELPGKIESCRDYEVNVNGERRAEQATAPGATCAPDGAEQLPAFKLVPAQVHDVGIELEQPDGSGTLVVTSIFLNACIRVVQVAVDRNGDIFEVLVRNRTRPSWDRCAHR